MGLTLSAGPAIEPITLGEAKLHLRIDHGEEDDLINTLITAARQYAETYTGRQFITATWILTLDTLPAVVLLPRPPAQSPLLSFKYCDTAGVLKTLDATHYALDNSIEPARVKPAYSYTWPIVRTETMEAIEITYKSGYGLTAADVPGEIKAALKLLVGHWFESREAGSAGVIRSGATVPFSVQSLLWHHKVVEA